MPNVCLVDAQKGKVSLKLIVRNGGQSAGQFWIWKHDGTNYTPIKKLNGQTDPNSGEVVVQTGLSPQEIGNTIMTWKLLSCARIPNADNLVITINFYQDTTKLQTTSDIRYSRDYPQCSTGKALENKGQVTFTLFDLPETNRLWSSM